MRSECCREVGGCGSNQVRITWGGTRLKYLSATPGDMHSVLFSQPPTSLQYQHKGSSSLQTQKALIKQCFVPLLLLPTCLYYTLLLLPVRTMDRLALLNVVGVAAIGMLSLTALSLAGRGLSHGSAHAIPVWPQWDKLGRSTAEQLQALTAVLPVMIACYVAHQSLHPLVPLLQPYSDARIRGVVAAALLIAFGVFTSLAVGSGLAFGPELEVRSDGGAALACTA